MTEGPNHDLFVKTLAQIESDPKRWDQGMFWDGRCGTPCCFAGHALQIAQPDREYSDFMGMEAAQLLGIEWRNAADGSWANGHPLFHANNTLDDLYRISAELLGIDEAVLRDKVAAEVAS